MRGDFLLPMQIHHKYIALTLKKGVDHENLISCLYTFVFYSDPNCVFYIKIINSIK